MLKGMTTCTVSLDKNKQHFNFNDQSYSCETERQIDEVQGVRNIVSSMEQVLKEKIEAHNQKVENHSNAPNSMEVEACIRSLKTEFPTLNIGLIVKVLHEFYHQPCNNKSEQNREENTSISAENEAISTSKSMGVDYSVVNSRVRAKEAVNIPIDPRMSEQKRVAISYLNYGYGVRILRDYINDPSMNPTKYNNIITSIMKMSFRKLEEFIKSMGKSVVAINSMEEKIIRAPLTNCEKWMPPDQLEVFYRLIKYATALDHRLDIQPQTAVKLYNSCIRQLQQRQANQAEFKRKERRDKRQPKQKNGFQVGSFMGEMKGRQYDHRLGQDRSFRSGSSQRTPPPYGRYTNEPSYASSSRQASSQPRHWQSLSQQSRYQLKPHAYKQDYSNYTTY